MNLRFAGIVVGVVVAATSCGGGSNLAKNAAPSVAPVAHVWSSSECENASQSDWFANCQQYGSAADAHEEAPPVTESSVLTDEGKSCLLYTSDAADEEDSVDLGGRRIIK